MGRSVRAVGVVASKWFRALALAAYAMPLLACGSAASEPPSTATVFDGVYRGDPGGEIGTITFADGKDYTLASASCHAPSCTERGTYAYDEGGGVLSLTNEKAGATKRYAIEVFSTAPPVADGVQPKVEATLTAPNGATLTCKGKCKEIISEFFKANGQPLTRDDSASAKGDNPAMQADTEGQAASTPDTNNGGGQAGQPQGDGA
jgi:hypothetical protein